MNPSVAFHLVSWREVFHHGDRIVETVKATLS
jgi:hypothetical protein